jgi:hypothetical protein
MLVRQDDPPNVLICVHGPLTQLLPSAAAITKNILNCLLEIEFICYLTCQLVLQLMLLHLVLVLVPKDLYRQTIYRRSQNEYRTVFIVTTIAVIPVRPNCSVKICCSGRY